MQEHKKVPVLLIASAVIISLSVIAGLLVRDIFKDDLLGLAVLLGIVGPLVTLTLFAIDRNWYRR